MLDRRTFLKAAFALGLIRPAGPPPGADRLAADLAACDNPPLDESLAKLRADLVGGARAPTDAEFGFAGRRP